jgi:hypothetical protein
MIDRKIEDIRAHFAASGPFEQPLFKFHTLDTRRSQDFQNFHGVAAIDPGPRRCVRLNDRRPYIPDHPGVEDHGSRDLDAGIVKQPVHKVCRRRQQIRIDKPFVILASQSPVQPVRGTGPKLTVPNKEPKLSDPFDRLGGQHWIVVWHFR